MSLLVTPHGHLMMDTAAVSALEPRVAAELGEAAERSSAEVLRWLATRGLGASLPPSVVYWREFSRRYFSALCHTVELPSIGGLPPPGQEDLAMLAFTVPPMPGAEYVGADLLGRLWGELNELVFAEVARLEGGVAAWLKTQSPLWNLVGRVTFHLAENKKDLERPFAFLATYTHRLSDQAKPQYMPLGRALQEYAGASQRAALLGLLAPVQRAAEKSQYAKELVESQRIYQPQRWTAQEAYRFLREVPTLEDSGVLVRLPDWWKGGRPSRPTVNVTVGGKTPAGIGLEAVLDFEVELVLDGEAVSEEEWRRLADEQSGLVQLKGKWVEVDREKLAEVLAHWQALEAGRRQGGLSMAEGLRMLAGTAVGDGAAEADAEQIRTWSQVRSGQWLREVLGRMRAPESGGAQPVGLQAVLRPYQLAGVNWLCFLAGLGLGACLADDMGLGKTVQVLASLLHLRAQQPAAAPALLVLPASLLGNWRAEAARFAPSLRVISVHPSEMDTERIARLAADPEAGLGKTDVVLTTYGLLPKQPWLRRHSWSLVVLDEAQAIKNPGTRQTKAVKELRAPARIAMTGTPVENKLGDLWSLFDFLNPGLLGGAAEFTQFAKRLAQRAEAGAYAPLRQLVAPYILRRLKSDRAVIADLPDKTEMNTWCTLTKRQAMLYEQTVRELSERLENTEPMQRRGLILTTLMRLKQLCNHPAQWGVGDFEPSQSGKFARLAELVGEIAARQEKVLVFTQFRELTGPLQQYLAGLYGCSGLVLHGGTPVGQRRELVEQFQRESGPPFFVLSLKAGGTGLTLTEAGHVIHFDRWWNPAVENQATDRAYRIGQKKNVLVHKFVCRGTVEERIDQLIADKQALAAELFAEGAEVPLTEMADGDLLRFLSLDIRTAVEDEA
jgi:non-specific serine/threonine protein kinase